MRSPMERLGLTPKKIKEEELQRGDQICTDRNLKSYYHHGIYIGNDRVIHFSKVSLTKRARKKDKCNHHEDTTTNERRGVRMCCLKCFVRKHSLYRFEYGKRCSPTAAINLGGSTKNCDDVATVVKRATELLKNDNFGEYSLGKNNCESFAYFCKTNKKCFFGSKQVLVVAISFVTFGGMMG